MPNLPTNIDSTYNDDPGDPSVKAHQQAHDELHAWANAQPEVAAAEGHTHEGSIITGFRAFRAASQTLAGATHTTVIFDSEVLDEGADYDPATGTWTVPADGWYDVAAFVQFTTPAVGERMIVTIRVDGADHSRVADTSSGDTNSVVAGGSVPMKLTAGDLVTVAAWRENAGQVGPGTALTYFTAKSA